MIHRSLILNKTKNQQTKNMRYHYFPIKPKKTSIFDVLNLQIYILWHFSPIFKQMLFRLFFSSIGVYDCVFALFPKHIYNRVGKHNNNNNNNLSIAGLSDLFTDFQFSFFFCSGVSNSWKAAGRGI